LKLPGMVLENHASLKKKILDQRCRFFSKGKEFELSLPFSFLFR